MPDADLIEHFSQRARAISARVEAPSVLEQALRAVVARAGELGAPLAAPGLVGDTLARLEELCQEAGVELVTSGLRERGSGLPLALTPVDWGVAETGTLIIDSASEELRLASMLAEEHWALLPVENIRPDLESLQGELAGLLDRSPSYVAFISGPSRTADIERVMTIGVHGPRELVIMLLGEGEV